MPPDSDIIALALSGGHRVRRRHLGVFHNQEIRAEGRIVAREPCIVAGLAVAEEVFRRVDANLEIVSRVADGTLRDSR